MMMLLMLLVGVGVAGVAANVAVGGVTLSRTCRSARSQALTQVARAFRSWFLWISEDAPGFAILRICRGS